LAVAPLRLAFGQALDPIGHVLVEQVQPGRGLLEVDQEPGSSGAGDVEAQASRCRDPETTQAPAGENRPELGDQVVEGDAVQERSLSS
jgi:hypothetical protein